MPQFGVLAKLGVLLVLAGCACPPGRPCGVGRGWGWHGGLGFGRATPSCPTAVAGMSPVPPGEACGKKGGPHRKCMVAVAQVIPQDCYDLAADLKRRQRAKAAFKQYQLSAGVPFSKDFQHGFEEGYVELASGGNGRLPAIPPHQYWGPDDRDIIGFERGQQWLSGFSTGTQQAYSEGLGAYYQTQLSASTVPQQTKVPSWAQADPYAPGPYPVGPYANGP